MAYKLIHETFWTDPDITTANKDCKLLMLFLTTNPFTHFSGIYWIPKSNIAEMTGFTIDEVNAGLITLRDHFGVEYDDICKVVLIPNMLKYQIKDGIINHKHIKGIETHLKTLHNSLLIPVFLDRYKEHKIPYRYPIDTLSIPHRYPTDTPPKNRNQESEEDTKKRAPKISDKENITETEIEKDNISPISPLEAIPDGGKETEKTSGEDKQENVSTADKKHGTVQSSEFGVHSKDEKQEIVHGSEFGVQSKDEEQKPEEQKDGETSESEKTEEQKPAPPEPPAATKDDTGTLFSPQIIALTELLIDGIKHNDPKNRELQPGRIQKTRVNWATEIDKIHRIDHRPHEDIEAVIAFSQSDTFWLANILSGNALRRNFDKLYMQMMKKRGGNGNGRTGNGNGTRSNKLPDDQPGKYDGVGKTVHV